eukprot:CAMPEP_0113438998 /NCGR_PEP_ID=MMETSP0013_2-20120614/38241_1 /TAXON_ID=2843 ORGANISM="Skeletonema costatum, Strain 1716" /NCGR_SAMPLE_ID=MMETSP0013_2 /ASSEMBLY_ACC=CAM_ASM_000158 /LENGTH=570 /DNA_ID=CAMNT_0000329743 /DNA_START=35 /DNA_END=1750 /DNA_ORIENTATION=- /assembly_acc=CAM_ASM_000158
MAANNNNDNNDDRQQIIVHPPTVNAAILNIQLTTEEPANSLIYTILHTPTLWSILAMTSIVALLVLWEETIHNIRSSTPKAIVPVIDSMLAEVGGLGFIGLFLSTVVTGGPLGQIIGRLSEDYLGDEELLLEAFEFLHNNIRSSTPKAIVPVIDSMLAEVGGLGFIGLFLSTVVTGGPLGQIIGRLSEDYLGDEELLLEAFEFLHTFFFEVGILFFVVAGVCVGAVLEEVNKLSEISELALDADGDGEVTLDELAEALDVSCMIVDTDGDGILSEEEKIDALKSTASNYNFIQAIIAERSMSEVDRAGECLVARERILGKYSLPQEFDVELSPITWLPLIPLIALENSVDLSRDVVSASSSNAFESCGYFFATPWVFYPTIFFQALSLTWALFNFWKMTSIKKMLLPTLVTDGVNGEAALLPPRYTIDEIRNNFNSSPSILLGENCGAKTSPPRNEHEELFGAVGAKFEGVYRDSMRFSTWLCVALIVYSTTQIVFRDMAALYLHSANVGNPEGLVPELIVWIIFTASAVFQLSLAPTTFLNYCFVTSVEEYVKNDIVDEVMREVELCET